MREGPPPRVALLHVPGAIRTRDLSLRRRPLYPSELRGPEMFGANAAWGTAAAVGPKPPHSPPANSASCCLATAYSREADLLETAALSDCATGAMLMSYNAATTQEHGDGLLHRRLRGPSGMKTSINSHSYPNSPRREDTQTTFRPCALCGSRTGPRTQPASHLAHAAHRSSPARHPAATTATAPQQPGPPAGSLRRSPPLPAWRQPERMA